MPLEYNVLGVKEDRFYPVDEFWRVAASVGNKVIIGCDAHRPDDVANPEFLEKTKKKADAFGLDIIEPDEPKFIKG